MPTRLNSLRPARDAGYQNIQYLRKDITFADNGTTVTIGTVPAGAVILKPISGVMVGTVFNAGTNNFLDIGNATTGDLYGTDLSLLAATFVPIDEAVDLKMAADTTITCAIQLSGTAATTGVAQLIIAFIPQEG